jgi:hypothetical protein
MQPLSSLFHTGTMIQSLHHLLELSDLRQRAIKMMKMRLQNYANIELEQGDKRPFHHEQISFRCLMHLLPSLLLALTMIQSLLHLMELPGLRQSAL